jgi:uncharacterized protein YndB with AHSA1/START domain
MYIRTMIEIQTSVRIARPASEVFALLSDPTRFPLWNSAVDSVRPTGSTFAMERTLPGGRARNELEITELGEPERFGIRTLSGPTPFAYRYRLTPDGGATLVALDATVELGRPAELLGPLAARAVKHGIDANLATLRDALERGGR